MIEIEIWQNPYFTVHVCFAEKVQLTFAVGHLALGYIIGKTSSKIFKVDINIPSLFVASIIPDIDLLIPGIEHRGPTHSIILLFFASILLFVVWKKKAIPFIAALISHPVLGDYLTSTCRVQGIQLFFPLTKNWFYGSFQALNTAFVFLEVILLGIMLLLLVMTKDLQFFTQSHSSNILFAVPIVTALLPVFTQFPIPVPTALIIPHLILIILLSVPILIDLKTIIVGCKKNWFVS
ncbi:metal-dependent hydrolase [Candidatus Bathyarchaeota archaeon]|nr:metal-dependent hydrolase [Candidatus Bathyarchaeota archaeon]